VNSLSQCALYVLFRPEGRRGRRPAGGNLSLIFECRPSIFNVREWLPNTRKDTGEGNQLGVFLRFFAFLLQQFLCPLCGLGPCAFFQLAEHFHFRLRFLGAPKRAIRLR